VDTFGGCVFQDTVYLDIGEFLATSGAMASVGDNLGDGFESLVLDKKFIEEFADGTFLGVDEELTVLPLIAIRSGASQ
jgi:hypothetical protein